MCYGKDVNWALPPMMQTLRIYTACQMWQKLKTLDILAEVTSHEAVQKFIIVFV